VQSVTISNIAPADTTYANDDNVSVQIEAQDNESPIVSYTIKTSSSLAGNEAWTSFSTPASDVNQTVYHTLSGSDGLKSLYVWVKNSQDNVSASTSNSFDNITLDTEAPDDNATPNLTGSAGYGVDNTSFTDNLTVTLDNLTNWITDTGSGIDNGSYFLTDNATRTPAYDTTGWRTLNDLSFDISTLDSGNSTVGSKTIYIFVKDNASNVSSRFTSKSIFFDNVSPDNLAFTLSDADTSADNESYDLNYTNSDNVTVLDNLTVLDNASGVNGSGVVAYFFTDNSSYTPLDNDSGWLSSSPYWVKMDNSTNGERTIYGWAKDATGNVAASSATSTIAFDNATPMIDNLTLGGTGFVFSGTGAPSTFPKSATVTFYLSANDNESTGSDNYSSGWKEVKYTYYVTRSSDNTTPVSEVTTDWLSFSDNLSTSSDNYSFDNASFTLTITSTNYLDNRTSGNGNQDNLTVIAWLRDNASNMSDNITTVFSLDNSTIYYDR